MEIKLDELPDGWVMLEAAVVLKCLDENGTVRLVQRYTDGLNAWESLGMLDVAAATQRKELTDSFEEG